VLDLPGQAVEQKWDNGGNGRGKFGKDPFQPDALRIEEGQDVIEMLEHRRHRQLALQEVRESHAAADVDVGLSVDLPAYADVPNKFKNIASAVARERSLNVGLVIHRFTLLDCPNTPP
jgi:hypothetical protein